MSPAPLSPDSATISLYPFPVRSGQFVDTLRGSIPRQEGRGVTVGLRSLPGHMTPATFCFSSFVLASVFLFLSSSMDLASLSPMKTPLFLLS